MAGLLDTMFGGGAEREAAERDRQIAQQYGAESQKYLTTGYDTGVTNLNKGVAAYDPLASLATKYGKAGDLNLDALGVNGPEGFARAQSAFQTTPGYQISLDQGLEAINRRAAIGGMGASGGTDTDAMKYAMSQLYGTQYAPWLANLQHAGDMGGQYATTAAGGQAAGFGNLAGLAERYAGSQAGVAGNVATGMTNASNLQGQGEATGAKNLLGAGLSLASMATNVFAPGAGSLFSGAGGPISLGGPSGPTPLFR